MTSCLAFSFDFISTVKIL